VIREFPAGRSTAVAGEKAPKAKAKAAAQTALRKAVFAFHLYVGIGLSLWFVLLGLTGAALVFAPQVDALLNPGLMRSARPNPQSAPVSPDAALSAARAYSGETPLKRMAFPAGPDGVYEFRSGYEKRERDIFVDAYTGAIKGEREHEKTVVKTVLELHKSLLLHKFGENINGWAALLLAGLLATGIWLWWPATLKQLPARLKVKTDASPKRLLYDLHNVFGVYTLPILTLIALTGAVFIFKKPVERTVYALTGTPYQEKREEKKAETSERTAATTIPSFSVAAALRQSEAAAPGARLKHIDLPDAPDKPVRVHWERADGFRWNNKVRASIDPRTGVITKIEDERNDPLAKRLMRMNGPLHEGKFGGVWTQWLYLVIAVVTPLALTLTGFIKWRMTQKAQSANRAKRQGVRTA
jgi:uncharacterized iron-regulated membrane protein